MSEPTPNLDAAPCVADDCEFVAKNEFGLQAHVRAKHTEPVPAAEGPPAPPAETTVPPVYPNWLAALAGQLQSTSPATSAGPPPAPDGGTRRFRCKRYPKQILAPGGKVIGQFENGELVTDDPRVIALCESLEYVEALT